VVIDKFEQMEVDLPLQLQGILSANKLKVAKQMPEFPFASSLLTLLLTEAP